MFHKVPDGHHILCAAGKFVVNLICCESTHGHTIVFLVECSQLTGLIKKTGISNDQEVGWFSGMQVLVFNLSGKFRRIKAVAVESTEFEQAVISDLKPYTVIFNVQFNIGNIQRIGNIPDREAFGMGRMKRIQRDISGACVLDRPEAHLIAGKNRFDLQVQIKIIEPSFGVLTGRIESI